MYKAHIQVKKESYIMTSNKKTERFNQELITKAKKYYGTDNLSTLSPYQLDKLATWMTWGEDKGKNQSRKAENRLRANKRYQSRRTYNKTTDLGTASLGIKSNI